MKPILAFLIVIAVASARAQQQPPIVPAQPVPLAPPKALEKRKIEKTVEDTLRPVLDLADQATADGLRLAQRAVAGAAKDAAAAARDMEAQLRDMHNTFTVYGPGSSRGNRSLVIQTSDPDPLANANAEEDLAIMSRILRKAIGNSQDERRRPLGIDVDGSVFGSASGARNIYLDGYGAVFLLTVRYPLIGAPEKPEEAKAKDISTEWKEAQEEELQSRPGGYGAVEAWPMWTSGRGPVEDYDAEKVDRLKTSLLESLKNATHVRALKPNDFVTVVVQGAEAIRVESAKRKTTPSAAGKPADADSKAPGNTPTKVVSRSSRSRSSLGETVMTIRVKKSDADAFAQGKLDLDAFRKKAAIQTYFRRTDSTSATAFQPATVR